MRKRSLPPNPQPFQASMTKISPLNVQFLGTGTSQGIPVIGCDCPVCNSDDPRDQRLRCSILLKQGNTSIVIDTGPDFRQQMIRAQVHKLDGVVFTHEHNDHIIGLDDVRPFNFRQGCNMPVFAHQRVCDELKQRFAYVFATNPYPGVPQITLHPITKETAFQFGDIHLQPIEYFHGKLPVLGFRIGDFAYLTDMKTIEPGEMAKLEGVKHLAISALHHNPHHAHMNLKDCLEFILKIKPQQAYLIHMSHYMGLHAEVDPKLPQGVRMAYDGLEISC